MKVSKEERIAFGRRLESYIKSRNISQDELAIQCDLSRQTINNIVNGKTNATSEVLAKMASIYYDLNLNWLITGKGSMEYNTEIQEKYDPRLEYTHESLIQLLEEKKEIIEALKNTIRSKDEIINYQKEIILSLKK